MRRKTERIKPSPAPSDVRTYWLSTILTAMLGIGFTQMMVTTYDLECNTPFLVVSVVVISFLFTLLHIKTEKRKWISLAAILAAPVLLVLCVVLDILGLMEGLEHVMWYLKVYSFRNIEMNFVKTKDPESVVTLLMVALNIYPALVTSYVITRRKNILFSLLTYVPFFVCSVALNYMFPGQIWCEMALAGVILLCVFQNLKCGERSPCDKRMLMLILPILLLTFTLGVIYPKDEYDKQELAVKEMQMLRELANDASKTVDLRKLTNTVDQIPGSDKVAEKASKSYMGSVIMEQIAQGVTTMNPGVENLNMAGNFDPPLFAVMHIRRSVNPDANPPHSSSYLYLKSSSMDTYTGNQWSASFREPDYDLFYDTTINIDDTGVILDPSDSTDASYTIRDWSQPSGEADYVLHVENAFASDVFFVPYYVDGYGVSSDVTERIEKRTYFNIRQMETQDVSRFYDYALGTLPLERDPGIWSSQYITYLTDIALDVPPETERALLESGKLPDWFMEVYNGEREMSDMEKVRAVTDFVSRLHPYDAHTDFPPTDKDFVVWFVTEATTGFCVHYASTAVILLRMLGVPTRYVTGYMVDSLQNDKLTDVMSSDAHAWFEFFLPEYGWILGDATPGNDLASKDFDVNGLMEENNIPKEALPSNTVSGNPIISNVTRTPITRDPSSANATKEPTKTKAPDAKTEEENEKGSWLGIFKNPLVKTLSIVLLALVVLALIRAIYSRYWQNAMKSPDLNESARAYYRYFSLIAGKWKTRPASRAYFIAQKATFSEEGISEQEHALLVTSGKRGLAAIKKKQPWYRRIPVSLLWEIKI